MKKAYHIAIEGTIGVGKTSLAKILSNRLDSKLILEEFEDNPFLSDFYKDSKRYAFQTQLFFYFLDFVSKLNSNKLIFLQNQLFLIICL